MPRAAWVVIGPSAVLGLLGRWRGPDATLPTPAEDWRQATIDVVIPAGRDQQRIVYCLASLLRQTLAPRRVRLVGDNGVDRDHTVQIAREFARATDLALEVSEAMVWPTSRAGAIQREAAGSDADVLLVLDGDTVLESPEYLEACVRGMYQGVGIASACGTVLPLRPSQRSLLVDSPGFQRWLAGDRHVDPGAGFGCLRRAWRRLGDAHGDCVASIEQRFIQRGLMAAYGGVVCPGGAVLYRRRYLKDLFDRYAPIRGDNLGEVEELFIGPALNAVGYRNILLEEVVARVDHPEPQWLPGRAYRWSASLLQGGHYFDALLRTPIRPRRTPTPAGERGVRDAAEMRLIAEAYRQPFGERLTQLHGRPIGNALLAAAIERVGYPALLLSLLLMGQWPVLAMIVAAEVALALAVLAWLAAPGSRRSAVVAGFITSPLRYALILADSATLPRFAAQLWVTGERRWFVRRGPRARLRRSRGEAD